MYLATVYKLFMKLIRLSVIFFISLLTACANVTHIRLYNGPTLKATEEAVIVLPEEFELLELNQQPVSDTRLRFRTGNLDLRLPSGEHTFVLQYKAFWEVDDDNHDTLTSAPITFKLNLAPQETIQFQFPALKQYEDAIMFTQNPNLFLVSNRQKVEGSYGVKDNALILTKDELPTVTTYPNLEQLKFWWNRATYYEKTEFLNWKNKANNTP